jgi:cyclopropane-fatty-acyl-phospholipid synthase
MSTRHTSLADLLDDVLGPDLPVRVCGYDGTDLGPPDAPATVQVRSPDALRRMVGAPGELGLARAYVAGDLDVEGDLFTVLALRDRLHGTHLGPSQLAAAARLVGTDGLHRLPAPPEEARLSGRRHTKARDAAAVAHHYDVSNRFYELVLGPSLTYSCALWDEVGGTLEAAQAAKHELICRKLRLAPGMRLLDIGCGWGSMALHAALEHGVEVVGVTVSARQAELAEKRIAEAGVGDRVAVRLQDYREVDDGPYDAVSSIGMFEHVGAAHLREYFGRIRSLLRPGGRVLNHGIVRRPQRRSRFARRSFIDRYVFPDGELHDVGRVATAMEAAGLEVRHGENLREHYALTLRRWVANLEHHWDEAVAEVGAGRARVWRLYMAACAVGFERGDTGLQQLLGVRADGGCSGFPLRPAY